MQQVKKHRGLALAYRKLAQWDKACAHESRAHQLEFGVIDDKKHESAEPATKKRHIQKYSKVGKRQEIIEHFKENPFTLKLIGINADGEFVWESTKIDMHIKLCNVRLWGGVIHLDGSVYIPPEYIPTEYVPTGHRSLPKNGEFVEIVAFPSDDGGFDVMIGKYGGLSIEYTDDLFYQVKEVLEIVHKIDPESTSPLLRKYL